MKQLICILIAVVVLGGLYFYVESQKVDFTKNDIVIDAEVVTEESSNEGETDFVPSDTTSGMRVGENAIVSLGQRPGNSVKIAQVFLAAPGYIVIYDDIDGDATTILGSSTLLPAGESTNVTVPLSQATIDGEQVWAFLFTESNDTKKFDVSIDTKVIDSMGESISSWIEIQANAEEITAITL